MLVISSLARWSRPASIGVLLALAGCDPSTDYLFGSEPGQGGGGAGGVGGSVGGFPGSGGVSSGGAPTSTTSTTSSSTTSSSTSTGPSMAVCGDGICAPTETSATCPADCEIVCAHSVCSTGSALALGCDPCVDQVCAQDPFCCDNEWDGLCVSQASDLCGAGCCGDGVCDGEDCGSCPQDCGTCVCGDGTCAQETCTDCPADCGFCADCPHTVCFEGPPLDTTACFDPCVTTVCAMDPSCCGEAYAYDEACQAIAAAACPGGNPCVSSVCALDPTCCTTGWTASCVALAVTECGTSCDCEHSVCQTGAALDPTCNPCVADLCLADSYCCAAAWDGICVDEVASVCGVEC